MGLPLERDRITTTHKASQLENLEAYHLAVIAREAFGRDAAKAELLDEHDALCMEIEWDLV
jgi:hypothetical protein